MLEFLTKLLSSDAIQTAAVAAVGAAVSWLAVQIGLKTKRQSARDIVAEAYDRLLDLVDEVVRAVWQEVVDGLKKRGAFDEEKAREAKEMALARVLSTLAVNDRHEVKRSRALSGAGFEKFVGVLIESAIQRLKTRK